MDVAGSFTLLLRYFGGRVSAMRFVFGHIFLVAINRRQMWLAKFTFFPILKGLCAEKEVQLERPSFFSQIQEFDY